MTLPRRSLRRGMSKEEHVRLYTANGISFLLHPLSNTSPMETSRLLFMVRLLLLVATEPLAAFSGVSFGRAGSSQPVPVRVVTAQDEPGGTVRCLDGRVGASYSALEQSQ